jgi:hypothetical protein
MNISNNIWFTRKARIVASERLANRNQWSQIILVYYSVVIVCLSIVSLDNTKNFQNLELLLTISSVILLVISLLVSSQKFLERSIALKANYIELQKLYLQALEAEEKENSETLSRIKEKYIECLSYVENHTLMDDITFRVRERLNLESRKPSKVEIIKVWLNTFVKIIICISIFLFPFIFMKVSNVCF